MEELEFDTMEECAILLREAQSKLEQLESRDDEWNKYIREEIDVMCAIITS
jgi:hypothetical protein